MPKVKNVKTYTVALPQARMLDLYTILESSLMAMIRENKGKDRGKLNDLVAALDAVRKACKEFFGKKESFAKEANKLTKKNRNIIKEIDTILLQELSEAEAASYTKKREETLQRVHNAAKHYGQDLEEWVQLNSDKERVATFDPAYYSEVVRLYKLHGPTKILNPLHFVQILNAIDPPKDET